MLRQELRSCHSGVSPCFSGRLMFVTIGPAGCEVKQALQMCCYHCSDPHLMRAQAQCKNSLSDSSKQRKGCSLTKWATAHSTTAAAAAAAVVCFSGSFEVDIGSEDGWVACHGISSNEDSSKNTIRDGAGLLHGGEELFGLAHLAMAGVHMHQCIIVPAMYPCTQFVKQRIV